MRYVTRCSCVYAIGALGLVGCATNPVTGRQQLSLVPESSVISQSAGLYNGMIDSYRSSGKIVTDAAAIRRVTTITDRLVQQAILYRADTRNWAWEFQIVNDQDTVNAFCFAGGKMAIFTGLLQGLDLTDDELAQVMAHEVSHALLNHSVEQASVGMMAELLGIAVSATANTTSNQDMLRIGSDLATSLVWQLPNSRGAEAEADEVGIELAAKAGFDPNASVTLWQKMTAHGGSSKSQVDWFNTHPASTKRLADMAARVELLYPIYVAAQTNSVPAPSIVASVDPALVVDGPEPLSQSLMAMCDMPSLVDRAECLGQIEIGMLRSDVVRALGAPNEQDSTGTVLRYSDRFLQLDASGRVTRILDHRP